MKIESPEFGHDQSIPAKFTCEGKDTAPALRFSGVPKGAKSLALIVDDPDAPDPARPQRVWVHWVAWDLPPGTTAIPEGGKLPTSAHSGTNDFGKKGYGGPCPPIGRHRYFFKVYALDRTLGELGKGTKHDLERAMKGHVVAEAQLVGTYQKGK